MTAARPEHRGGLKIFLGYAAGVGKTYKMLEEAQQLRAQGRDIAVGYFEPHGRQETIAKLAGLEVVPRRLVPYRGCDFEEMDADAILARRPEICVVDELPHTNVPGLAAGEAVGRRGRSPGRGHRRPHDHEHPAPGGPERSRARDLRDPGARDRARLDRRGGERDRRRGPDAAGATQPTRARSRLPEEKAAHAMENFFREPTLAALREMALRQAAHAVDARQWRLEVPSASVPVDGPVGSDEARERILIHMTDSPATSALIRRGRRVADYLKAECFAVAVVPPARMGESAARRTLSRSTWPSRDDCTSTRAGFAPETWRRPSSISRGGTGSRRSWSRNRGVSLALLPARDGDARGRARQGHASDRRGGAAPRHSGPRASLRTPGRRGSSALRNA